MEEEKQQETTTQKEEEEAPLSKPFRIGVLGAAWIAPEAVINPARNLSNVVIHAVAARDVKRAQAFAKQHSIPVVHASYEELIADSELDAIYVPLPNSHHKEWTIKALKAGKHVLCEKPLACTTEDVREMFAVAKEEDKLLLEAFHWRFHPLAKRMKEIVDSGVLGKIHRVHASMCIPILRGSDIRYNFALGGGATMDTGCYAINCMRYLVGDNVPEDKGDSDDEIVNDINIKLVKATAVTCYPQIDKHMKADFVVSHGTTTQNQQQEEEGKEEEGKEKEKEEEKGEGIEASIECSIYNLIPNIGAVVKGDKGEMRVVNFVAPHYWHKLTTKIYETPEQAEERKQKQGARKWWMLGTDQPKHKLTDESVSPLMDTKNSTYWYQLKAFVEAAKGGVTANSKPRDALKFLPFYPQYDAVGNAMMVDEVYQGAGLKRRGEAL